ncbi:MAG: alpha/beta fold hydrolase [Candidatus Undinarchaeales archaeon]|jgi:hypothetical protein|nr:alpha/beta fold hydrolase [Candidatus Undinarchaeales archaeon]HIJ93690.1 alpha/beta fold hydrolase [Rhodospirillaceae bacterium]
MVYVELDSLGATLAGDVFEPEDYNGAAVVLCHGFGTDRTELYDLAEALQDEGFVVLAYDGRAHGQSGGSFHLDTMVDDVHAARRFLEDHYDVDKCGVFGHSFGGYLAVRAAAETEGFDATVSWATPISIRETLRDLQWNFEYMNWFVEEFAGSLHYASSYRKMRIDDMGAFLGELYDRDQTKITETVSRPDTPPSTFIYGELDKVVKYRHAEEIGGVLGGKGELVTVAGAGHSCLRSHTEPPFYLPEPDRPEARRQVVDTVVDRFKHYLTGG